MRTRWWALPVLSCLAAVPAAAQATADQARLSFGIAAGATSGTGLWTVTGQPLLDGPLVDTLRINRRIRGGLGVVFYGIYFPSDHWGFTGEAMLVGLGFEDDCERTVASGSLRNAAICDAINQNTDPSTAVALSVGALYRVWSRHTFSPYARAHLGLAVSQHSSIQVEPEVPSDPNDPGSEPTQFILYDDPGSRQLSPVLGLGVGFTAALGHGYQLRWEGRDNIIGVQRVTGTTFGAPNLEPSHSRAFKHVFSVTIGFEVVLERRRGRRY